MPDPKQKKGRKPQPPRRPAANDSWFRELMESRGLGVAQADATRVQPRRPSPQLPSFLQPQGAKPTAPSPYTVTARARQLPRQSGDDAIMAIATLPFDAADAVMSAVESGRAAARGDGRRALGYGLAAALPGVTKGGIDKATDGIRIVAERVKRTNPMAVTPRERHYESLVVRALDSEGNKVGTVDIDPEQAMAWSIVVQPEHRRKGIASRMLDEAESQLGRPVVPHKALTTDGRALFEARAKRRPPETRPDSVGTRAVRYFDHYSPHPDLRTLDASFMGTGKPGAEKSRPNRPQMSHVYREGQKPEIQFARMPKYRVRVEGDVYDIGTDPEGVVKRLQQRHGGGAALADAMERELQKRGYAGYSNSDDWNNPYGIAKLFGQHPMRRAGAVPQPGESFAILTAQNPGGKPASRAENSRANTRLRKILEERGYDVEDTAPTSGYKDEHTGEWLNEQGFIVRGITPDEAMALGREFGQNSVVTDQGLHDLVQNKLVPSKGFIDGGNEWARTDVGLGSFALDLDWDNARPLGETLGRAPAPERALNAATENGALGMREMHPSGPDAASRIAESINARTPASAPNITVNDPAPAGLLDTPEARPEIVTAAMNARTPGGLPEQRDIMRHVGPRIPQQRIDDVEEEFFQTYTSPPFERWVRDGQFGHWYDTRGTEQKAIDALGEEEGMESFDRLIDMIAAVTARSDPKNNLRRASYYRGLEKAGLLDVDALASGAYKAVPEGMGHLANNAHHVGLIRLLQEGGINSILNPKPAGFGSNLRRNFTPFTNDTRMAVGAAQVNPRLVDMGGLVKSEQINPETGAKAMTISPRDWAYAPSERAAQRAARQYAGRGFFDDILPVGADPTAFFQAKAWDGIGRDTPGSSPSMGLFDDVFNQSLSENAQAWGVSPAAANQLFWEGHPFDLPLRSNVIPRGLLKRFGN